MNELVKIDADVQLYCSTHGVRQEHRDQHVKDSDLTGMFPSIAEFTMMSADSAECI